MNSRQRTMRVPLVTSLMVLIAAGFCCTQRAGAQTHRYNPLKSKASSQTRAERDMADEAPAFIDADAFESIESGPRSSSRKRSRRDRNVRPTQHYEAARRRSLNSHRMFQEGQIQGDPEVIGPGTFEGGSGEIWTDGGMEYGDGWTDYGPHGDFHGGCDSCGGGGCDSCGGCDPCGYGGCDTCGGWWWCDTLSLGVGVHGYKDTRDFGFNGNFGFNQEINWGMPLSKYLGIGWQLGVATYQSNFDGASIAEEFFGIDRSRDTVFITTGIFHRAVCGGGIQWGVAWDYMHDDYWTSGDVSKIRAEIGLVGHYGNEIGFFTSVRSEDDTQTIGADFNGVRFTWRTNDLYAFYLGRQFCSGAHGRIWGGFTGDSDGLFGAQMSVPFTHQWSLAGTFNYLIPNQAVEGLGEFRTRQESWFVGINVVWSPGTNACGPSPWRPLFNVANPGIFMTDLFVNE